MSNSPLLRIGAFSRASSLSVKTLRAYHEGGLLVPAEIDASTGYRAYSVAQLLDAAIIRRLRQLDVPLAAIREVLDARDPAVTRKVLADHAAVVEERLAAMQLAIDELYAGLESPTLHTPGHRRHEPARVVLTFRGTVTDAEWLPFLERARTSLLEAARASAAVVDGAFGACYPPQLDDDVQEVDAFIPVAAAPLLTSDARSIGISVGELPATDVFVVGHRGSYDDLNTSYRNLGASVATHAEAADFPVRELYVVGPGDTDDPDKFLTEICWPVKPEEGEGDGIHL